MTKEGRNCILPRKMGLTSSSPAPPPIVWFEAVSGVPEDVWMLDHNKSASIVEGDPVDGNTRWGPHLFVKSLAADGTKWDAGAFSVWSLSDLERQASLLPPRASNVPVKFEIHVRGPGSSGLPLVEVSRLQAAARPEDGPHMFQVASNFNCLEVPSKTKRPDDGSFVTNLMYDSTQVHARERSPVPVLSPSCWFF